MTITTIFIIAVALSIDAFAVSISCGLKLKKLTYEKYFKIALAFGLFQALMPLLGWSIGHLIKNFISQYANIIAFTIFLILGLKTVVHAYTSKPTITSSCDSSSSDSHSCTCNNLRCLMGLSVATSIDAFLIGPILALYDLNIFISTSIIGIVTFLICFCGPIIGYRLGDIFGKKAEFVAGIILIIIAIKTLLGK
ncbi:MAG: manganese efflux pump [Oligoflexia bacterium]|nr:manganese efflux pump [Oligoflexia bacterium]